MAIPSNFISGEILEASELNEILTHLKTGLTVPAGPSTSRPIAPANYQVYFDTSLSRLLVWTGSSWANVPTALTVEGGTTVPASPSNRQIWYNETTDTLQIYDSDWKPVVPTPAPPTLTETFSGNVSISNTRWTDTGATTANLSDLSFIGGWMQNGTGENADSWGHLCIPVIKSQFEQLSANENGDIVHQYDERVLYTIIGVTLSFGRSGSNQIVYASTSQSIDLVPFKIWKYQ